MEVMPEIHKLVTNRHEAAKAWKTKTGGKVIGCLSINLPEELIYAAGILPVRILGSHEPEVITDPYMWNMMHCVSARDCLAQGLQGRYAYLDGLANAFGCPHTRQCTSSWRRHVPTSYFYELYVPVALNGPHAQSCLRGEIEDFKNSLQGWTGKSISDDAIDHAIEVYNQTRRLMTQLSEFRKSAPPLISGADFMEIGLAGMLTDKEEFNILLEQILVEISRRNGGNSRGARVMLAGGCNSDIELIQSIEAMGTQVVVDEFNTGGRYYMTEVMPEDDRLNALAARMVERPRCALKDMPNRTRPRHLVDLAKEYNARGVIFMIQDGCDAEQFDLPYNKVALENNGIPTLTLELDFTNPLEQLRTRIEAFLEVLDTR